MKNMKLDLHSIATTCMLVAVIVFTSCSDDEAINNPTIPEQPEQLTELTAQYNTNIAAYQAMMNGKAEIVDYTSDEKGNYKLQLSNRQIADVYIQTADDKDISYVRCEYMFNGEKKEVRSSVYNNGLVVNGLSDVKPCNFTIYLVDHSENQSEPYSGSFTPLEPPYKMIFKTISMQPDFGGVTIRWKKRKQGAYRSFPFGTKRYRGMGRI